MTSESGGRLWIKDVPHLELKLLFQSNWREITWYGVNYVFVLDDEEEEVVELKLGDSLQIRILSYVRKLVNKCAFLCFK